MKDEIDRAQRAASDADKQRKRLAMEKDELVSALEDAESALEQEEAKVLNAQNEIAHMRQEFERRLMEKDEDFEATRLVYLANTIVWNTWQLLKLVQEGIKLIKNTPCHCRKNHQHAIESLESSLEAEQRGKSDAIRAKKKLESEINELEAALDSANRGRMEAEKNVKKHQQAITELRQQIEDEHRAREEADKQVLTS